MDLLKTAFWFNLPQCLLLLIDVYARFLENIRGVLRCLLRYRRGRGGNLDKDVEEMRREFTETKLSKVALFFMILVYTFIFVFFRSFFPPSSRLSFFLPFIYKVL